MLKVARRKLRQLQGLNAWQWRVVLTSPMLLLAIWTSLRIHGYARTLAAAQPAQLSKLPAGGQLSLAQETAYALAVALKHGPWRPRCLLRSLALATLLGRKGIAFDLRIGVPAGPHAAARSGAPDPAAHAWVEHVGMVLNDRHDVASRFSAFDTTARTA